jgi:hypothetical protein
MFLLKLALVCAVVLAASFAAKRFGHGVAGTLSGLPMIAGPITTEVMALRSITSVMTSSAPSNEQRRFGAALARKTVVGRLTSVVEGCRACARTDSITQLSLVA